MNKETEPLAGYGTHLRQSRDELVARVEQLEAVLSKWVDKVDLIHADPRYQSVWFCAHGHIGPYTGPQYTDELAAARRALHHILSPRHDH